MTIEDLTATVAPEGTARFYRMDSGRLVGVRVKTLSADPTLPKLRVCGFWAEEDGAPRLVAGAPFEAPPSEHTVMAATATDLPAFVESRRRRMAERVDTAVANHQALADLPGIDPQA